ncbi:hypothetical protein DBV39_07930 [Orrella marina]|uniref:Uncharacterized protein n=1 Tax=Orrella marina TaxID=2163011 RepID=A0A2R4XIR5_9BURK|nr:hypothetical protein DBV39_07930 [Orrella marina]
MGSSPISHPKKFKQNANLIRLAFLFLDAFKRLESRFGSGLSSVKFFTERGSILQVFMTSVALAGG